MEVVLYVLRDHPILLVVDHDVQSFVAYGVRARDVHDVLDRVEILLLLHLQCARRWGKEIERVYVRARRVHRSRGDDSGGLDDRLGLPIPTRLVRRDEEGLDPRKLDLRRGRQHRMGVVGNRACPLLLVVGEGR